MPGLYRASIPWLDIIWWGGFCLTSLILALVATLDPNQYAPVAAVFFLWFVVVSIWGVAIYYWIEVIRHRVMFQFISQRGAVIGWASPKYAVTPAAYQAVEDATIARLIRSYPNADRAMAGCFVLFREPKFISSSPAMLSESGDCSAIPWYVTKASGLQEGSLIQVGWTAVVENGALAHELGHRILLYHNILSGDDIHHRLLAQYGL